MTAWIWIGFVVFVLALLALDLGALHRRPRPVSAREALGWSVFWSALALAFNALVFWMYEEHWLGIGAEIGHELDGSDAALRFFTAFLLEKSLSVDNVFVVALIFTSLRVPAEHQHRVLFWGVLGALAMRGVMIGAGLAVYERHGWLAYAFGVFLLLTAVKMLLVRHDRMDPERNLLVRLLRSTHPVTDGFRGDRFLVHEEGRRWATPLCVALALVVSADLLFAVDAVPAAFAVTTDPFLVFTANAFAVLGLRSMYFVLAAAIGRLHYLRISLVFILAFVGVKMLLMNHYAIRPGVTLAFVGGMLAVGVAASLVADLREGVEAASPLGKDLAKLTAVTAKTAWRFFVLIAGATMLLVGAALLVLPGPGLVVIAAGLALLATEFVWARAWMKRARKKAAELGDGAKASLFGGEKRRDARSGSKSGADRAKDEDQD